MRLVEPSAILRRRNIKTLDLPLNCPAGSISATLQHDSQPRDKPERWLMLSRQFSRCGMPMRRSPPSEIRPIPRRGLSRDEAAMYIGISASKFDELVRDGRMPGPKRIDGRKIWDVRDLDVAFDALPGGLHSRKDPVGTTSARYDQD